MTQHVVIIGGRATGTAAYVQLVPRLPRGSRITVVDPNDSDHPAVFGDPADQLITNTSAHIGSIVAEDPDDFLRFLAPGVDPHGVPRHVIGSYVRARFAQFAELGQQNDVETSAVTGFVTDVCRASGRYLVRTSAGKMIEATDVILAVGPGRARVVAGTESICPYPTSRLLEAAPERALVVGMGPSGIDAALVLASAGVPVHMVSRSGFFPAVRSRTVRTQPVSLPTGQRTLCLREVLERYSLARGITPALHVPQPGDDPTTQLRQDIAAAAPEDSPWQDRLADVVYLLGSREVKLTDEPKFVWRHLTSVMRTTATWLADYIEQGLVTTGTFEDADARAYPLVVSAVGSELCPLFGSASCLSIGSNGPGMRRISSLDEHLRVRLPDNRSPERIWAIGPSAGLSRSSNGLCVAVAQAREVSDHIAALASAA